MVSTSLVVAVTALAAAPSPVLQADYSAARAAAAAANKPMAVFIGGGKVERMVADGSLPADAARLLRENYVCVVVNTETGAGKDLAGRFEMAEGLVISGPGGASQALRHAGAVSGADLTQQLTRYATAGAPVTTVSAGLAPAAGRVVTAGYSPVMTYAPAPVYAPVPVYGGCAGGSCGVPVMTYGVPFGGSSCANGRCR
jgi:hypothetical protein